jgi:hypothetical protein
MSLTEDWDKFLKGEAMAAAVAPVVDAAVPIPSPLYISTKSYDAFLSSSVDIREMFWAVPVMPYAGMQDGVIKKEMMMTLQPDEVDGFESTIKGLKYASYRLIPRPRRRDAEKKDVRIVTVGMSNKDITPFRVKDKSAFYNCFVAILRLDLGEDEMKEVHCKVFNTGNMKIIGIKEHRHLRKAVDVLVGFLKLHSPAIEYMEMSEKPVLINSNFQCGFNFLRDKLFDYFRRIGLRATFDPCSYPGIKCAVYYDEAGEVHLDNRDNAFTIVWMFFFRTGSVLIVGKCTDTILANIYKFITPILADAYPEVRDVRTSIPAKKPPRRKFKTIYVKEKQY